MIFDIIFIVSVCWSVWDHRFYFHNPLCR